jgi:GTP-binding protein YchF
MDLGIIGLPQSGKTSLFRALTAAKEVGSSYDPGGSVETLPARLVDDRLERLAAVEGSGKTTYAQVNVADVTGLISGEGRARQTSAELLGKARTFDLLVLTVRAFASDSVPHPLGSIDPARDVGEIESELIVADLEIAERRIDKLNSAKSRPKEVRLADEAEIGVIEKLKAALEELRPVSSVELSEEERFKLRSFSFLTGKPALVALNVGEGDLGEPLPEALAGRPAAAVCARTEAELLDLEQSEREEFARELGIERPASEWFLREALRAAGMISFFTLNQNEARAWLVPDGEAAATAAGKVHRDMERGFIRAEVVGWEDFLAGGPWKKLRGTPALHEEGRDCPVRDGQVINVKFSA